MTFPDVYYAVIFSSQRTHEDADGYAAMGRAMVERASLMDGFLGIESARDEDGTGITVSYWEDLDSIENWKTDSAHLTAQRHGKERWYKEFSLRIARVEQTRLWNRDAPKTE